MADQNRLFVGQFWNYTGFAIGGPLSVSILDFKTDQWSSLKGADKLSAGTVSALALEGDDLWVGGMGYIALVSVNKDEVRKFAYIPADKVDLIQIGGGYVWAQYDCHLHRAPLRGIR